MKSWTFLYLASAMLAGCALPSGSPQNEPAQPAALQRSASTQETLTGRKVKVDCKHTSSGTSTTFTAHGIAGGLYSGTFTANGMWTTTSGTSPSWTFAQSFKITAKGKTIHGTLSGSGSGNQSCKDFGANQLDYTLGKKTGEGSAFVESGDLGELLHKL